MLVSAPYPAGRLRRLRATPWIRKLTAESHVSPSDLILPLFVSDQTTLDTLLPCYTIDNSQKIIEKAARLGIAAVMLFPVISAADKNAGIGIALDQENILHNALRTFASAKYPLGLWVDVALDPYTSHGHDGLLVHKNGDYVIDNDATIDVLAALSCNLAEAGATGVCPSDMMDGRIGAIRSTLDKQGHQSTLIISYAVKYASCFYGPFRDVLNPAGSLHGLSDKKTYQMDPRRPKEALAAITRDSQEGADMCIIKPGLPYLDIIATCAPHSHTPILAYQVSAEYAMIKYAAQQGVFNEKAALYESFIAFKRAGATGIITYAALEMAQWLTEYDI